jgi:hypothetical protein
MLAAAFTTTEFQSKALWFVAATVTALLHQQHGLAAPRAYVAARVRRRPLVEPMTAPSVTAQPAAASVEGPATARAATAQG